MKIDPRFKDTEFVVEADSFAHQTLWEQWSTEALFHRPHCNNIKWEQDSMGLLYQVGTLDNCPVNVGFVWAKLNGHLILFYDACSQIVDHLMVESWLKKYCNTQNCNASNFHHVINYIQQHKIDNLHK